MFKSFFFQFLIERLVHGSYRMYGIEQYLRPMSSLAFSWAMFQRLEDGIKGLSNFTT